MSEQPPLSIVPTVPEAKSLLGPRVLLMGPSGSGKTYALGTLGDWAAKHGKKLAVMFVEQGAETLAGYWADRGLPVPPNVYWQTVDVPPTGLSDLITAAEQVGMLNYQALTKVVDVNRSKNNPYLKVLKCLSNFKDDRSGQVLGPVDQWGGEMILAVDSLSELANAAMKMQIGTKPTADKPDYMVAQNNLMNLLRLMTQGIRCTFIMTAHIDRFTDDITQVSKISVKAIGQAISGDIPPLFSDVVLTVREIDKFYWDTAAYGAETKTRSLGYRSKITPDFGPLMDVWLKRGGK